MKADRPGPLVLVYFEDIHGEASWCGDWRPKGHLAPCVEVGWMVRRTKRRVTLVRGLSDYAHKRDRDSGARVSIPMGAVVKIVRLREP